MQGQVTKEKISIEWKKIVQTENPPPPNHFSNGPPARGRPLEVRGEECGGKNASKANGLKTTNPVHCTR